MITVHQRVANDGLVTSNIVNDTELISFLIRRAHPNSEVQMLGSELRSYTSLIRSVRDFMVYEVGFGQNTSLDQIFFSDLYLDASCNRHQTHIGLS
ncbi:Uncharacterised protein [Klebsiella pneumoniae]|nr:Uncharacterised protein [Klebsiella pneumoniae]